MCHDCVTGESQWQTRGHRKRFLRKNIRVRPRRSSMAFAQARGEGVFSESGWFRRTASGRWSCSRTSTASHRGRPLIKKSYFRAPRGAGCSYARWAPFCCVARSCPWVRTTAPSPSHAGTSSAQWPSDARSGAVARYLVLLLEYVAVSRVQQ